MSGRYSEQARRVIRLSQEEARRLGFVRVAPEHILLGLIAEKCTAVTVLRRLAVGLDRLRDATEDLLGRGKGAVDGTLPFDPAGKAVVEEGALAASQDLGDHFVGTEHILMGLFQSRGSRARMILEEFGVTPDAILRHLNELRGSAPVDPAVRQLVRQAADEAFLRKERQAGYEHVLLAMLRHGRGRVVDLLAEKGVTLAWLEERLRSDA